jgi:TonB-linked SusC/RagA family outer membrane protein
LDDVIVVGYGTAKRRDFSGSVASLKIADSPISNIPNLNVLETLKGTITGLNVGGQGRAEEEPSLLVRGENSINGSNKPLIVLDGVIFTGDIRSLNNNDIASVDVLKDAVSASAYGSRSANGILAITTKKGRTEKPVVTFGVNAGVSSWGKKPVLATPQEYVAHHNAVNAREADDTSWITNPEQLDDYLKDAGTTDFDDAIRTGSFQDYNATVSGMTNRTNYYMSVGYRDNKGVFVGDDMNSISLTAKLNTNITDWFSVGFDAGFSKMDFSGNQQRWGSVFMTGGGNFKTTFDDRNVDLTTYTGMARHHNWGIGDGKQDDIDLKYGLRLNAYATVKIPWIKGLSYKINYQPNVDLIRQEHFTYETSFINSVSGPYTTSVVASFLNQANGSIKSANTYSYVVDNYLTYQNSFGKHNVDLTFVATRDYSHYNYNAMTGSDFSDVGSTALGLGGLPKAAKVSIGKDANERANVGYLGKIAYNYDSRYMVNASLRRDGASVFGADKKWGLFGAVGAAWAISEENFLKGAIKPLDYLKLKASWGQTGNQGLDPYKTLATAPIGRGTDPYTFDGIYYGLHQDRLANPNMGWEKTSSFNVGFESNWFKNRLSVNLDVFHSETTDQIFERGLPTMTGFGNMYASMGQVDNTGIELTVNSVNIENRDWRWSTMLNFWKTKSKVVHLYGEDLDGNGVEDDDLANSLFIGHSLGAIYNYKQIGIVQENETDYIELTKIQAGRPKYDDMVDGVPGLTPDDRMILGYDRENFRMNLGNTVKYKNLELYVLFTGIFGGGRDNMFVKNNRFAYSLFNPNEARLLTREMSIFERDYWTPENHSDTYPVILFNGDSGRDTWLQSRTFVRLQNITLSYTFDKMAWLKSAKINSLSVFASGKNLFTFTGWFFGDPERGSIYSDGDVYPQMSVYTLGLNFSF